MPKKCKKLVKLISSNINEELDVLGIRVKDQQLLFTQEPPHLKQLITNFVHEFGEFKTIADLTELWSSSASTRAKDTPRPQNAFMLFRKNISKGIHIANIKMPISECSKTAGYLWRNLDSESKRFWYQLSYITKEKHHNGYPNYKYNPKHVANSENENFEKEENSNKVNVGTMLSREKHHDDYPNYKYNPENVSSGENENFEKEENSNKVDVGTMYSHMSENIITCPNLDSAKKENSKQISTCISPQSSQNSVNDKCSEELDQYNPIYFNYSDYEFNYLLDPLLLGQL